MFFFFKLINELRLRLPLSDREEITSEAKKAAGLTEDDYESRRALKVAQATVSSLQVWLVMLLNPQSIFIVRRNSFVIDPPRKHGRW